MKFRLIFISYFIATASVGCYEVAEKSVEAKSSSSHLTKSGENSQHVYTSISSEEMKLILSIPEPEEIQTKYSDLKMERMKSRKSKYKAAYVQDKFEDEWTEHFNSNQMSDLSSEELSEAKSNFKHTNYGQ